MERKDKLYNIIDGLDESVRLVGYSLVDRMLYLEERLFEIEKLPFIQFSKTNPYKQRELPARKIYVGLLQQYNIVTKSILKLVGVNISSDDNDEFMKYLKTLNDKLAGA